ncbi:MAG TPA: hypothetical protein VFN18_09885 [Solirubrobacterales bacterium]|nr:hypothetical protein [Solirubrobacterales bacterium]
MGKAGGLAGVLAVVVVLGLLAGCGGGTETTSGETTPKRPYPRLHGPSREFLIPGGDNVVQFFGQEAPEEREEVSRIIHAWMKARVAKEWAKDCKYLSKVYIRPLVKDAQLVSKGKATNCPQALAFFGPGASGTSGNTLTGPIDSLRVRGVRAFAQWHGPHQIDWVLPLRNEDGTWKIESASPVERTK